MKQSMMRVMDYGNDRMTPLQCCWCGAEEISPEALLCPHCRRGIGDVLPPGTLLRHGRYRIERALGKGGFGITYAARDTEFERRVAIKEFFPSLYARRDRTTGTIIVGTEDQPDLESGLDIFRREGRLLAQVVHPGVPVVHDRFDENGTAYLVMEFLEGRNLRSELQKKPLPEDRVRQITDALVSALAAVHAQGICHLDIKPDNVIIQPDGRVVLIDFGAARQGSSFGTRSVAPLTPQYAPLELLTRDNYGPESDIFELGMMVYEMLTGIQALRSEYRQVGQAWEPSDLSEPWRTLVTEATRLNRADRPSDIRAWWNRAVPPTVHSAPTLPAPSVSSVVSVPSPTVILRHGNYPKMALFGAGLGVIGVLASVIFLAGRPSAETQKALPATPPQNATPLALSPGLATSPSPPPQPEASVPDARAESSPVPSISPAERNARTRELKATLERFAKAQDNQIKPLLEKIFVIVRKGANVRAADSAGITALHLAAALGRQDMTRFLIEQGANVNAKDRDGLTPLHMTALGGSAEVAKLLKDAGANSTTKDKAGKTPVALAKETASLTGEAEDSDVVRVLADR